MGVSLAGILVLIVGGIMAAVLGVFLILFAIKFFKVFFRGSVWSSDTSTGSSPA